MSLGGTRDSPVLDSMIQQVSRWQKAVVIFAAAGNQPVSTPTYPAADPGVNGVTALSQARADRRVCQFLAAGGHGVARHQHRFYGGQTYVVQGTSPSTADATGVAVGNKRDWAGNLAAN